MNSLWAAFFLYQFEFYDFFLIIEKKISQNLYAML